MNPTNRDFTWKQLWPDLQLGVSTLRQHKLRSILTMLGIVFGVAAVISMQSIGAGAQQQVMAFIEQMGVRNIVVEAKESKTFQDFQKARRSSSGLTFQDYRAIRANLTGLTSSSARKRFRPSKMQPKPDREMPLIYGVESEYRRIASLQIISGRFFDSDEGSRAAPVCVLGQGAKTNLFGASEAIASYIKVNDVWFRVIGVVGPQLTVQSQVPGLPAEDLNNVVYIPIASAVFRLEDSNSRLNDEIDGIYLQIGSLDAVPDRGEVVRALLQSAHNGIDDFSVIVPVELLSEQKRTQRIFDLVMVAIASVALLVGGIGIMNIMLASVLERTREIGIRRAVGARQNDVIRQFLIEAIVISIAGGLAGILVGIVMSQFIGWLAGWTTVITTVSIIVAFGVSVSVGLAFGIYPARRAAQLDPVEALRYE